MTDDLQLDFADFEFSAEENQRAEEQRRADQAQAAAYRTRARINTRRAKSEAHLAEILPAIIEDGDAYHIISGGDIDSLSYLAHLLATTPMRRVILSTWCMAMEDVRRLAEWLETGTIGHLDAYVGEIFPNQYADEFDALRHIVHKCAGRVAVFRNHSKIYLCEGRNGQRWVIESSANINTNPRAENTVITADAGLYDHHKAWFDGIHAFNREFDTWTPTP